MLVLRDVRHVGAFCWMLLQSAQRVLLWRAIGRVPMRSRSARSIPSSQLPPFSP